MPDGEAGTNTIEKQDQRASLAMRFRLVGLRKDAFDEAGYGLIDNTLTTLAVPPNAAGSVVSNAFLPEDEYQKLYVGGVNSKGLLQPPYILRMLDRICQENNALSPCVEAMVTNIDGTGFVFERDVDNRQMPVEDDKIDALWDFFLEPWPGESFLHIRKRVRRDIERTGNGYIEIIRNAKDDIVFLRWVDAKMMRIVKLDAPTVVTRVMRRNGRNVKIKMQMRERRFAQLLNGRALVWFKEFGASRDLDKTTGIWAEPGQRLPANLRASEILHFIALPDAHTPYGVPRWICQLPSALGSRKAEEFNLDYFDNGGVPPLLILLQGGVLAAETRKAMENGMNMGAKRANRVQILEAEPIGGAIDSPSTARITIERFGHDRQTDSMFEKYDDKCEQRIRRGFRLPPIFVGQAQEYSFATAYASYTVAEAQVFQPEREEFDEVISVKLLPALGFSGYRMRSKPMKINDTSKQLQAIELAGKTDHVDPKDLILEINDVMGLNLRISPQAVLGFGEMTATLSLMPPGENTKPFRPANKDILETLASSTAGGAGKPTPSSPPPSGAPDAAQKQDAPVVPRRGLSFDAHAEEEIVLEHGAFGVLEDTIRDNGEKIEPEPDGAIAVPP